MLDMGSPYAYTMPIRITGEQCYAIWGGLRFDDTGRVFKKRGKRPIGLWYAKIGGNREGAARERLVRRDKLNDVPLIEGFRWRVWQDHGRRMREHAEAFAEGQKLGRIWNAETKRFHVYNAGSLSEERLEKRRSGAVDRLANVPTPDEEDAGERFFAAAEALERSWSRTSFADMLLRYAFSIAGPHISPYDSYQPRTEAVRVEHAVNGRLYVHFTPAGWGQETVRLWPSPTDERHDQFHDGYKFANCRHCGVRFKRSSSRQRSCDVCNSLTRPGTPAPVRMWDEDRR